MSSETTRSERSGVEFGQSSVPRDIGIVVGVFAIVGVGLGITGYFSLDVVQSFFGVGESGSGDSFVQAFVAIIFLQSVFTSFFLGPVVGGVISAFVNRKKRSVKEAVTVGGVGSFIGFYPMIVLTIVIMAIAFDGGGGTGGGGGQPVDFGNYIGQIVILAVPTGLVGGLSSGLIAWNRSNTE